MAKGQRQTAQQQLNTTNTEAANLGTTGTNLQSAVEPTYENLMETGYTSPAAESAAVEQGMGATASPYGAARFTAANSAAATGNPADLTSEENTLAREEGTALGGEANQLALQKQQGQLAGAAGVTGLSDTDLQAMEQLYGIAPGLLNSRAAGQSTLTQVGDFLGNVAKFK